MQLRSSDDRDGGNRSGELSLLDPTLPSSSVVTVVMEDGETPHIILQNFDSMSAAAVFQQKDIRYDPYKDCLHFLFDILKNSEKYLLGHIYFKVQKFQKFCFEKSL